VSWSVHDVVQLEANGVPTVVLVTDPFAELAEYSAHAEALPRLRMAVIAHPLGGVGPDTVIAKASDAVETVLDLLGHG
jgi:hypothetical protein